MNPPAAVQRPSAGPASPPRRPPRTWILFGVVVLAAAVLVGELLATPHFVTRLTVDNPTDYALLVEVSHAHGDGWVPLGTIDQHASTSFGEIYDFGAAWHFRLTAQTESAGTFTVAESTLERADWHLRIPARIGDALRANRIEPQP